MKDTNPIKLPPPRRHRASQGRNHAATVLWVVTALMIGLTAGLWFSGGDEKETPDSPATISQTTPTPSPDTASEIEVNSLLRRADRALNDEDDWLKARQLYLDILEIDGTNAVALTMQPVIDRHLESLSGSVKVETVPPGAMVKLGTFAAQTTPAIFTEVPLGQYQVEVTSPGFQTLQRTVTIRDETTLVLDGLTLEESAGTIEVTSLPAGIEYEILPKGDPAQPILKGKTPERIEALPAGEYEIKMAREGWPAYSANVEVQHNRSASVSHVFESGGLHIVSDPTEAEIWAKIDGAADYEKYGETPMKLENLPVGKVALELRYQDWPVIRRTVEVTGGDMQEPLNFVWQRGLVTFESDPSEAEVYLQGKRIGSDTDRTPFSIEMPEGQYQFTAIHPELARVGASAAVQENEDNLVKFGFHYGSVRIDSTPTGAGVVLDGQPIGKTPFYDPFVRPGNYSWTLQKDEHRSTTLSGEVVAGKPMNFSASLTYDPTPKTANGFANGLGQQMIWIPQLGGWVGSTEVTQEAYTLLAGENPSVFDGGNLPVDSISWYKANDFCEKLTNNERARGALPRGYTYRLPSDSEWSVYVGNATLRGAVTSKSASLDQPKPVGSSPPNEFGLYDVRGNQWEWCRDWYTVEILNRMRNNGVGGGNESWTGTGRKVLRGGAWNRSSDTDLAVDFRFGVAPEKTDRRDVGFRVVLMPE